MAGGTSSRVTPHTFRKTFATDLLNRGDRLETVAAALGHADTRVTQEHYAQLLGRDRPGGDPRRHAPRAGRGGCGVVKPERRGSDFAMNLGRLISWHGLTGKELAELIGASEHSVSGWLSGKRAPGGKYLIAIGKLFEANTSKMTDDPLLFGPTISDLKRYPVAEENIARARRQRMRAV